ncbi:MFS transporter [Demequina salsinemoris]|uniref:MFS transporter n=1 Tax=Demequina salsinemoris TaxID=577470 RepID=UPI000B00D829|nr:MFS transporter [Demequina salsinemoris]
MTHSAKTPVVAEGTYSPFRWFILATLVVVVAAQAVAMISPAPLIGEIMATNPDLSAGQVTFMTMGTWNLFVALAAIGSGPLLDKLGFQKLYLFGLVLIMVGMLLVPTLGDTYTGMSIARAIQAIGGGPIMAAGVYVAATCFPSKERSIATGAMGFAMSVGVAGGLSLAPAFLASTGDWQQALFNMWFLPAIGIVMTLIVMFGPKVAPALPANHDFEAASISNAAIFKKALLTPITWVAIGCVVLASWFNQAFNDMTPGYVALDPPVGLGLGAEGSNMLALAQFGQMAGAVVIGFVVERVFRGKVRGPIAIGFGFLTAGSLALLIPGVTGNSVAFTSSLLITLFFFAWINPAALGYIAKHYPAGVTGKLGGLAQGLGVFGGLLGVSAGSYALHVTGFYTVSTYIMAGVCALGLVLSLALKPVKGNILAGDDKYAGEKAAA